MTGLKALRPMHQALMLHRLKQKKPFAPNPAFQLLSAAYPMPSLHLVGPVNNSPRGSQAWAALQVQNGVAAAASVNVPSGDGVSSSSSLANPHVFTYVDDVVAMPVTGEVQGAQLCDDSVGND